MEASYKKRCRAPNTFWCILTIYAHLVLFISTSMIVPYLKYAILPVYRYNSSPLPLLLICILRMVCELIQINPMKTKEMIIRFCRDPVFLPYINMDGAAIERVSQVKVLGVTLSSDLRWNSHVDEIVYKARKRVFLIYQLKRSGIGQCDLVRIDISVIRPVVELACPAWHTNLPKYVSDNIELIQKRCMKTRFPGCSYDDILEMTNLQTLHDRRRRYADRTLTK